MPSYQIMDDMVYKFADVKNVSPIRKVVLPICKTISPINNIVLLIRKIIPPINNIVLLIGKMVSPIHNIVLPVHKVISPLVFMFFLQKLEFPAGNFNNIGGCFISE